jgi:glycosyltransferase involved in cell wall biosynthesis
MMFDNGVPIRRVVRQAVLPGRVRVVLVISNLEYGGAQRQVVELANQLDPARFDVLVCSLSGYVPLAGDLKGRWERLRVVEKRWRFDMTVVPRLARLLQTEGTDVVHSYLFDADIAARLAGRLAGTALVVGSERNTGYRLKRRQLLAYRLTRRCVDLIIANSHAGAGFNGQLLGHDRSMYRVVHNGVDTARFSAEDAREERAALGISTEERVIGMFGSFKPQKNHPLLFRAVRRLLGQGIAIRLLLAGDALHAGMHGSDEYKRRMHALVGALGIRERCLFVGNRADVTRFYRMCDVTVLPSLFEGTANVVLESMACGVPVVATDVSDNAYIVPDGQAGYIVPLGDEEALTDRLARLVRDDGLRATMGRRARAWVEGEFSLERLARKTGAVYVEGLTSRQRWRGVTRATGFAG